MKIDGVCHCGEIAWEAEINPDKILVCHCTDCQTLSGGPFRWGTLIAIEDYTLLKGRPKHYTKIAASGAARVLGFCGTCGTPLYGTQAENPTTYSLRLSSAKQVAALRPTMQMWSDSAISWLEDLSEMRKIEQPNPDLKSV